MKLLVTGGPGFIGSAVVERLCAAGHDVVGIDNINDYYDDYHGKEEQNYEGLDNSNNNDTFCASDRDEFNSSSSIINLDHANVNGSGISKYARSKIIQNHSTSCDHENVNYWILKTLIASSFLLLG